MAKPKRESKNYRIHGTTGQSRKAQPRRPGSKKALAAYLQHSPLSLDLDKRLKDAAPMERIKGD